MKRTAWIFIALILGLVVVATVDLLWGTVTLSVGEVWGALIGTGSDEGELTLLQSEYETLRLAMGGSILSGSVSMVVAYGNPTRGDLMVTDLLSGCEFTEDVTEWKQGDKFQEKTIPFIFLSKKSA